MAEEQSPESIPPSMTGHLPNLASMCDRDLLELVWENGQILVRRLSTKITKRSTNFPCSDYFRDQSSKARIQREGETSTANRSKDGVADSTFGDRLSGLSGLTKLDCHDKNKTNNSLQIGYPELLSELCEDGFNVVLGSNKKSYDKQLIDSNIVPVSQFKNFKQSYLSKLAEEIPQQTMQSNREVPQSSLKQYEASIKFMRSNEKKSRIDEKSDRVNFSIFLRPPILLKSTHSSCGATRPTSSPSLAGVDENLEGNAGATPTSNPFEKEGNVMARNMKPISPDAEPQKESLPDEQSEAVGYKDTPSNTRFPIKDHGPSSSLAPNTTIKGNPGNRKPVDLMVASSSVCSRGASNCPTYTLKRRYEDTDLSENNAMEEPEGIIKAAPAQGRKGAKTKRKAEVHSISERRRRDKINKKMRELQELIPNCNKVDKASMLDEAIEYLKTLQFQAQLMSMGTRVYTPSMMLPSAMQHINAQHLGGFSPMAVGMGMGMQMGLGCGPAQFPTSLISRAGAGALPGIAEARLNMLGLPGQVLLMSMPRSPFVSLAGTFSPQSFQIPGVSQADAVQVKIPVATVPQSTSKVSDPAH
ncbi:transcription factor PIF3-like [Durio zibethinus]|uniref:Transcription factor PIF3-like n=1 Tax=Durio zibethinus TaxID=66656 RepID=A0A6P5ZY94_DURZI|nr:transcription factor PIF3-like [Durio zibethinus]